MQVSNRDVWQANLAFPLLNGHKIHVLKNLEFAKLAHQLDDLRKPIEKARLDLVNKWAVRDADGNPVKEANGGVKVEADSFTREFNELMDAPCEVNGLKPLILPKTEAIACEKCHHNMDMPFSPDYAFVLLLYPFLAEDQT